MIGVLLYGVSHDNQNIFQISQVPRVGLMIYSRNDATLVNLLRLCDRHYYTNQNVCLTGTFMKSLDRNRIATAEGRMPLRLGSAVDISHRLFLELSKDIDRPFTHFPKADLKDAASCEALPGYL